MASSLPTNPARLSRVLVVDDDNQILETMQLALSNRGYEVILARDGKEGTARIERDAPDVVILDVMMPRRSGFAVLDKLNREAAGNPSIIVVTGNEDVRFQQYAESKGVAAYVRKPYNVETMLALVDRLAAERG